MNNTTPDPLDVETYKHQGYVVCPQVITEECADKLSKSVMRDLFHMAFHKEPKAPSPESLTDKRLFFDPKARQQRLNDPTCIWLRDNPRYPHVHRDTGMVNLCLNPEVRREVQFSQAVFEHIAALYGTRRLVYRHGLDRVSIKFPGAGDMPLHLDKNLFYDIDEVGYDGRFPQRVQAFVCGRIPDDVAARDSGTLEVVPFFHHYFALARLFFDPRDGLHPLQNKERGFHTLGDDFVRGLEALNDFIQVYTPVYHALANGALKEEVKAPQTVIDFAWQHCVPVPEQPFHLRFTPIPCEAGDLVCFDQHLPHRNLRNKHPETERIVFYVRLFPVEQDWYGSSEHREIMRLNVQGIAPGPAHRSNTLERTLFGRDGSFHSNDPAQTTLAHTLQGLIPHHESPMV